MHVVLCKRWKQAVDVSTFPSFCYRGLLQYGALRAFFSESQHILTYNDMVRAVVPEREILQFIRLPRSVTRLAVDSVSIQPFNYTSISSLEQQPRMLFQT